MLYYRLKNDIVNLSQVKRISKRDEVTPLSPFSKDEDKDTWEPPSNGKFIITVDDVDYQYDSLNDRDQVFGDIIQHLTGNGNDCFFSDRQALANVF